MTLTAFAKVPNVPAGFWLQLLRIWCPQRHQRRTSILVWSVTENSLISPGQNVLQLSSQGLVAGALFALLTKLSVEIASWCLPRTPFFFLIFEVIILFSLRYLIGELSSSNYCGGAYMIYHHGFVAGDEYSNGRDEIFIRLGKWNQLRPFTIHFNFSLHL